MIVRSLLAFAALVSAVACGSANDAPVAPPPELAIRSTDFALLPCSERLLPGKCVIVLAGGKRVMFGAPAGVTLDQSSADLRNLDAVMLLSLRGEDVEGLDELRNAAWRAGRESSLPVAGPSGTGEFAGILNRAYEVSDALIFVEERPAGGFDAALLAVLPGEGEAEATVFDTGDLRVRKFETGTDRATYIVDYARHNLILSSCGGTPLQELSGGEFRVLDCESEWPLGAPEFVFRDGSSD